MHLISLPASPFAARVRLALYAKGLPVEIASPPAGWPANRQFKDINPTGRVPVLILEDGETIWESAVILEFLEDAFPAARSLMPDSALARAKARLLVRHVDLYLMPPMVALAQPRQEHEAARHVEALIDGLSILDDLLEDGSYAVEDRLTIADCALAPALFAARVTGQRLELDLTAGLDRLALYAAEIGRDEHVERVLAEMEDGMRRLVQRA